MARRITLVIPSLGHGGAQRVAARMANHWVSNGNAVTLITLESSEPDAFPLNDNVCRVALGVTGESRHALQALWNNAVRIRRLRRAIRDSRPEHVISFIDQTNVLAILACARLHVDLIVSERTDLRHHRIGRVWSILRRWTYPRCRAIVVQTNAVHDVVRSLAPRTQVYVIPNAAVAPRPSQSLPVGRPIDRISERPNRTTKHLVAMGRLGPEKGFDLLIEAFARIADLHPEWVLVILGEGSARTELERLIQAKGLNERITLQGWVDRPEDALPDHDLFVLSSRYEGFPNALLEAMAAGLPVVSFDCDSGPAELIQHGDNGILVPNGNVTALAESLSRLMNDPELRQQLGNRAREVTRRFGTDKFFKRWESVFRGEKPESA